MDRLARISEEEAWSGGKGRRRLAHVVPKTLVKLEDARDTCQPSVFTRTRHWLLRQMT